MSPDPDPIANPEDLLGTYSFLPWLRQGVANAINAPAAGPRATINVQLQLSGTPISGGAPLTQPIAQDIQLFGPGDIIGIEGRAVVRTEPRDWVTNFESNYLAAIDFYDEDLPWRYTPAPPEGLQLLPWLALVVLQEGEFAEAKNIAGRPLPFVTVTAAGVFLRRTRLGLGTRALQPKPLRGWRRACLARYERCFAARAGNFGGES